MARGRWLGGLLLLTLAAAQPGHGQPPTGSAGTPTPPPATDYVIYFGFDEAAITPDSQDILAKAARDIAAIETLDADHAAGTAPHERGRKDIHSPSATVVAYADTAGSKAYNLRLARRRAKATADAMIALGVPAAGIAIRCKGESDPAVDTGDEVREPLNRRVTIHISAGGV
jgi:outer membrane protein OmpA-like peptidoglycan-associated protein